MRADRLRSLREFHNLTQDELSEHLGETQLQIWRWENGKSTPDSNDVAKIARFFNVTSDYLLGLSDDFLPGTNPGDLRPQERAVIAALRVGDSLEAIRVIVTAGE